MNLSLSKIIPKVNLENINNVQEQKSWVLKKKYQEIK